MRGWKPELTFRMDAMSRSRTLSPDNEGMETRTEPSLPFRIPPAGHSAPTMRGWKPCKGLHYSWGVCLAGHSAPTMRGWKLAAQFLHVCILHAGHSAPTMRDETTWKTCARLTGNTAGHSAPTMRMETCSSWQGGFDGRPAGHSAPTMRGWKHPSTPTTVSGPWAGHSAPTMRMKPAAAGLAFHLRPDTQPRQ